MGDVTMKFCGEIAYEPEGTSVHSDICFRCAPAAEDKELDEEFRKFLHNALDEWLDKSNGTGGFWLGDPKYFIGWGG